MAGTFDKIRKFAFLALVGIITGLAILTSLQARKLSQEKENARRLENNQSALLSDLLLEKNRANHLQYSVDELTLRAGELERLIPEYEAKLRDMGIRLKDAQHVARVQTELAAAVKAQRDTVIRYVEAPGSGAPTAARYVFSDAWLTAVIEVEADSVAALQLNARDSLTLVAHRQRRKCLFKKPGPTRYTVETVSPYSTVTGMRVIEVIE